MIGDFNAQNYSNQAILLRNYSNPNPLWLAKDLELANMFKRSYEDLGENLFGCEMVKFCSAQDIIIRNSLTKWTKSRWMTCIHGLGSSVVDYIIFDIPIYNKLIHFNIFNDHVPTLMIGL